MDELQRIVDFAPGNELRLSASRENLAVSSWDRAQVEIRARVLAAEGMRDEQVRRALESARIDVGTRGRTLTVACASGRVPLYFEIRAPRSLGLRLEAKDARVSLAGLAGALDLDTGNSHLDGNDLEGSVRLRMGGGSCRLTGFRGSFDVKAERGEIHLHAAELRGSSRLETTSGEAEIHIPRAQGLKVRTAHSRPWRRLHFEGIIGDGSAEIFARTHRGRIRLFRDGKWMGTLRRGAEVQWQRPGPKNFDWLRELVSIVQSIRP